MNTGRSIPIQDVEIMVKDVHCTTIPQLAVQAVEQMPYPSPPSSELLNEVLNGKPDEMGDKLTFHTISISNPSDAANTNADMDGAMVLHTVSTPEGSHRVCQEPLRYSRVAKERAAIIVWSNFA